MIDDLSVTLIDSGMPVVVLDAEQLGLVGDETPQQLENNHLSMYLLASTYKVLTMATMS